MTARPRVATAATGAAGWIGRGIAAGLVLGIVAAAQAVPALRDFLLTAADRARFALLVVTWLLLTGAVLGLVAAGIALAARALRARGQGSPRAAGALWGALAGGAWAGWCLFALTYTGRFDRILARGPWLIALAMLAGAGAGWSWVALGRPGGRWRRSLLAPPALAAIVLVHLVNANYAPSSSYGVHLILTGVLWVLAFALVSLYPAPRGGWLAAWILPVLVLLPWCDHVMRTEPALEVLLKTRTSSAAQSAAAAGVLLDWDRDGSWPARLAGGWDARPWDPSVPPPILGARRGAGAQAVTTAPAAERPLARPHVLLVTLDACRADVLPPADRRLSPLGALQPPTPVLDSLAAHSAVFDAAYTPSAGTEDSFNSLFSGQDPPGTLGGVPPERYLPSRLSAAGYARWALICDPSLGGAKWGWPQVRGLGLGDGRWVADSVAGFLADLPEGVPGFAWVNLMELHAGVLNPLSPASYRRRGHLQVYASGLERTDRAMGLLLEALRRRGLAQRTLLVVTADHGEETAEHGHYHHNISLYEGAIRVPLWVSGPGVSPGWRRGAVALQDLYPTLLEAAGVTPGASAGFSLWPQLRDPGRPVPARTFYGFLPQRGYSRRYALDKRVELGQAALVDPRSGHKLILRLGPQTLEAYDLGTDPGERRNLVHEHPGWLDPMLAELWGHVRGTAPGEGPLLR